MPVGSVVSNKASLRFTGKGAANYGQIQQENLMRLLENFADGAEPLYPTVGQQWYDTTNNILKVCTATEGGVKWRSLGGIQATPINSLPPSPAAIGDIWVEKNGTSSGIMYIYDGFGRHGGTSTTIGGWSQVWPAVEVTAGREEYDALLAIVNQLIGPTANGGSEALGTLTPALRNLSALDTSFQTKFSGMTTRDPNVLVPITDPNSELTVDVTSQDWDLLLAAARFAVARLDLPVGMIEDISPMPFVYDGRQVPAELLALPVNDVMYPSLERRSKRHFGIVTMIRAFSETMNVLNAALANRYSIKGINGANGANPNFASNVTTTRHVSWSGNANNATGADLTLRLRFNTPKELDTFLYSGAVIQITATHAGSGANDINLKTLFDSRGVLRITADKVRIFSNVFPLNMSAAPVGTGFNGSTTTSAIIANQSISNATYEVGVAVASTRMYLEVRFHFFTPGALTGTTSLSFDIIRDASTFTKGASTSNAFGAPLPYAAADKIGSTTWLT
ncbi:hypothetical protein [Acinetobacter sp.]|uniref:hypothetical protein n=1 Tax=Acinetobacter sp. TaxID=472 RepID=UPI00388FE7AF